MNEHQKERYKEKARIRMRRYRERKKFESPKRMSPAEKKKLRAQWREAKQKQRANLTPVRKTILAQKDLQRKMNALTPTQMKEMLLNTTPRKITYLKDEGLWNSPRSGKKVQACRSLTESFKMHLSILRKRQDTDARAKCKFLGTLARKARLASKVREQLNIHFGTWQTWHKYSMVSEEASLFELQNRKQRSDTLKEELKAQVVNFFTSKSVPIPSKRYASKSVLSDTTGRLHKDFVGENKKRISFSSFKKLRPKHVMTVDKTKFIGCMCEYCLNVDYVVRIASPET
jgi:hypothetical protein